MAYLFYMIPASEFYILMADYFFRKNMWFAIAHASTKCHLMSIFLIFTTDVVICEETLNPCRF